MPSLHMGMSGERSRGCFSLAHVSGEGQAFFLTLQTSPMTGEIAGLGCFGGLGVVTQLLLRINLLQGKSLRDDVACKFPVLTTIAEILGEEEEGEGEEGTGTSKV